MFDLDLFNAVKEAVSIPIFWEAMGQPKPDRGKVPCVFHEDRTPSMQLHEKFYHTFCCGRSGSVIDLTMALVGLATPLEAAKYLDNMFQLGLVNEKPDPQARRRAAQAAAKRKADRERLEAFKTWEKRAQTAVSAYLQVLHDLKRHYAPTLSGGKLHPLYVFSCHELPYMEYIWETVFLNGDYDDLARLYADGFRGVTSIATRIDAIGDN